MKDPDPVWLTALPFRKRAPGPALRIQQEESVILNTFMTSHLAFQKSGLWHYIKRGYADIHNLAGIYSFCFTLY